jgi:HSP20 family protein
MAQRSDIDTRTTAQRQQETGLQRNPDRSRGLARRDPFEPLAFGPFAMIRRMQEDIDRLFGGFGLGRSGLPSISESSGWSPAVDVFQRSNELVVRADLPGLSPDDVSVEIGEDTLTIRGERKYDHEEEREGVYHSERSHGTFYRVVQLPEGVVADNAKATFKSGVLEIVMPAPPQEVRRGRRLEIISDERSDRSKPERPT